MVEFRILGSVEVAGDDGSVIAVGGPRHRRLLATLLLRAGRVVPAARLTDALWPGASPARGRAMLHVRMSELRTAMRAVDVQVLTRDGGYLLRADPDDIDAGRFERLADLGAAALAEGDPAGAARHLDAGLALWRGPALAEFADEPFARSAAARLEELRLHALENRITADLDLGRHGAMIPRLEALVAEHPLRERFWAQLMLALYRADRQGEALAAYQTVRGQIAEHLGLDPSDMLQSLHYAILNADPALAVAPEGTTAKHGRPAQLPADVSLFTGREDPLRRLTETLLDDAREPAEAVPVVVVSGTAGVGKTALAVHWGHRHRGRFPDGQLYVDLRGYDPDQPLTATGVLADFLAALGVAEADIPLDVDARATRFRSAVAGLRLLVLLDNASSVEQVRPLLPGTSGCAVLVTSRDSMPGLIARNGAQRCDLDLLPTVEAETLLRRLIGDRADDEPDAVRTLVHLCDRLPLALRVAAELANSRPGTALATLGDELADQQQRLDLLDAGGDARAAVRAVFSWSTRHLPADAADMFRLAGLHPGADLDVYAAAALADVDTGAARRTLDRLCRAHLVHPAVAGRYGMHDLLRAYAAGLTRDDPARRAGALDRLFDYYLAAAAAAMDGLYPAEAHRRPLVPPATTPMPDLTTAGAAREWLDRERPTLVTVSAHARPDHTGRLSAVLDRYLLCGRFSDALTVHGHAYRAARLDGDLARQGRSLNYLGAAHLEMGNYDAATDDLVRAVALLREVGDSLGEGIAMTNLGRVEMRRGNHRAATERIEEARALFRRAGDHTGEARALNILGIIDQRMGRHEPAIGRHRRALTLFQRAGDVSGEATAVNNIGLAEQHLGRDEPAVISFQRALVLFGELGDQSGEASVIDNLGIACARLGRLDEAAMHFERAYTLYSDLGDREGQAWALNGQGEAATAGDRPADAIARHTAALTTATDIGARDQQARAHTGLGHAYRMRGDAESARGHYERAISLFGDLDALAADDVRAHLADLEGSL